MATGKPPQLAPKLILSILLGAIGLVPTSLAQMPGTPTLWHMGNRGTAVAPLDCASLNTGGTWVRVPGDPIYGTSAFCVQKYVPSNASNAPVSQPGTSPWVNISQSNAKIACQSLGTGYHLITNPEWMTIAANIANVGSNWSGGTVGNGELTRGHSDNNPNSACAADANDANAWVETNCTGKVQGTQQFRERRTRTLSNGQVIWDIGGNVWQWVDAYDPNGKPGTATNAWNEYSAMGNGTTNWPRSAFVPLNSVQSWWSDGWNSTQSIGKIWPGTNNTGGALFRGGSSIDGSSASGPFAAGLGTPPSGGDSFRCAYAPTYTITYDLNGGTGTQTAASGPYAAGSLVNVTNTTLPSRTGHTFGGWNTAQDGSGTTYGAGSTFTMGAANVTLYARWNTSGYYSMIYDANGATSGSVPTAQAYANGTSLVVASNTGNLARIGYTFAGWNTNAAGTGQNYAAGTGTFIMGTFNHTLYAKWNVSCGDSAANNCYTGTNAAALQAAGSITTASGKSLTFTSGVWVEAGAGTRVLAADGLDNWAMQLSPNGRSYSSSTLNKTTVAGRACPSNVYVDDTNKVATGRCLYYDAGNAAQRLDATPNDSVTDQTTAGAYRLGAWNTSAGGNSTAASWYEGNIQTCAAKGMRLPTLYETAAGDPGNTSPNYKPTDSTPTFSSGAGVPAVNGSMTWTASANTMTFGYYWAWSSSSTDNPSYTNSYAVRCVIP